MLTIIKWYLSSKCITVLFTCSLGNLFCFWIRGLCAFPITLNAGRFLRTIEHWPLRHICFRNIDPHQDLIVKSQQMSDEEQKIPEKTQNLRIFFWKDKNVPGQQQFWRDVSETVLAKQLCLNASLLELVVWGNQGHGCCGFHYLAYRWTGDFVNPVNWKSRLHTLGRSGKIIEHNLRMI